MYGEHPDGKCRIEEGEEGRRRRGCAQRGEKLVKCWEDLEELAQDRWWWREFIEALCIPQGATGVDCILI